MKRRELLTGLTGGAAALLLASRSKAQSEKQGSPAARPNILWLVIEDTRAHEFGCYGNPHAKTPILDAMAARGVLFERAWAAGPQCSPSRSSIITGANVTTYGSEWHRRKFIIPDDHFFPLALREAGYYCTNNPKTDYNAVTDPKLFGMKPAPKPRTTPLTANPVSRFSPFSTAKPPTWAASARLIWRVAVLLPSRVLTLQTHASGPFARFA